MGMTIRTSGRRTGSHRGVSWARAPRHPREHPGPVGPRLTIGPFDIRLYALCLLAGVVVADLAHHAPLAAEGGDPDLVLEVTLWSVLAGLIGGRLYHDITSWDQLGDEWYAPFAIWEGGLGIWGGVPLRGVGRARTSRTAAAPACWR